VPEVQTEMTVRAFSGTLRRIFGGVDEELWDPLTFSEITADAARELDNREVTIGSG